MPRVHDCTQQAVSPGMAHMNRECGAPTSAPNVARCAPQYHPPTQTHTKSAQATAAQGGFSWKKEAHLFQRRGAARAGPPPAGKHKPSAISCPLHGGHLALAVCGSRGGGLRTTESAQRGQRARPFPFEGLVVTHTPAQHWLCPLDHVGGCGPFCGGVSMETD